MAHLTAIKRMGRPKKIVPQEDDEIVDIEVEVREPIAKLAIDYPSEGLNAMARTINALIDRTD